MKISKNMNLFKKKKPLKRFRCFISKITFSFFLKNNSNLIIPRKMQNQEALPKTEEEKATIQDKNLEMIMPSQKTMAASYARNAK